MLPTLTVGERVTLAIVESGSLTTLIGGVVIAQGGSSAAGVGAVVVGVITAMGGILVPLARIWAQQKAADRADARKDRDYEGKLSAAMAQVDVMFENQQKILANQSTFRSLEADIREDLQRARDDAAKAHAEVAQLKEQVRDQA